MSEQSLKSFVLGCLAAILLIISQLTAHAAEEQRLSVAAFNTWGVPIAVWDTWRYGEAMKKLNEMSPDFILLEEVFSAKGRKNFHSENYPYEARGPRAFPRIVNSGLRILSKHPIERTATLVYRACKKDDCLSRKGAVLAVIKLPTGQSLNLVLTHLNARGEDDTRMDQLDQLGEFISYYGEPNSPVLLAGDFNFNDNTVAYDFLMKRIQSFTSEPTLDLWTQTHGKDDPGYTCDSINNVYARTYNERTNFPLSKDRIDYQFTTRLGSGPSLVPTASKIFFNEAPYYSDHYGLWGEYVVR